MTGTAKGRALGAALRKARKDRGLGLRELARQLNRQPGVLSTWETAARRPKPDQVSQILTTLGVTGEEYDEIIELAYHDDSSPWVATSVPEQRQQLNALIDFEQHASKLTYIAPLLIPGLLQTSDYIHAIMSAGGVPTSEITTRTELRLGRKDIITRRTNPAPFDAYLCVQALTHMIGSPATMINQRFPDGQLYVNLRRYDASTPLTPDAALERFLRALDVSPGAVPRDLEARAVLYRSLLAGRRMLVVLDNASSTGQVRPLLPGTRTCLALITSRNRLSGLVAREGVERLTLDVLTEPQAVALLRATINGYRTEDDSTAIAELAGLCARLPLALRVAAERASSRSRVPLADLIQDLRDESALWDMLSADGDEEADAVRTVFAWSYRVLSPDAARLFRLLGLHPGAELGSAAAAALAGIAGNRARHLLDVLVGGHMLEQIGRDRYQFHDLLRAYASDQLQIDEPPEQREAALLRLFEWYLHTARAAVAASMYDDSRIPLAEPSDAITPGVFPSHQAAVDWYELERANLTAVTIAANIAGHYQIAWKLPAVLRTVYEYRHPFDDWFRTGEIGLDAARRVGDKAGEATILHSLGKAHTQYQEPSRGPTFQMCLRSSGMIGGCERGRYGFHAGCTRWPRRLGRAQRRAGTGGRHRNRRPDHRRALADGTGRGATDPASSRRGSRTVPASRHPATGLRQSRPRGDRAEQYRYSSPEAPTPAGGDRVSPPGDPHSP